MWKFQDFAVVRTPGENNLKGRPAQRIPQSPPDINHPNCVFALHDFIIGCLLHHLRGNSLEEPPRRRHRRPRHLPVVLVHFHRRRPHCGHRTLHSDLLSVQIPVAGRYGRAGSARSAVH